MRENSGKIKKAEITEKSFYSKPS